MHVLEQSTCMEKQVLLSDKAETGLLLHSFTT